MLSQAVAKNKGNRNIMLVVFVDKSGELWQFFVDFGWNCLGFLRVKKGKLPLGFFASRKTQSAPEELLDREL